MSGQRKARVLVDDVDHRGEVAGLRGVGQVDEYADLKRPPIGSARLAPGFGDETLPTLRREADVDVAQHFVATRVTVTTYDRQCIEQAAVLSGRLDILQVEQSEQEGAVPGTDWPEQRYRGAMPTRFCIVPPMPKCHLGAFRQIMPEPPARIRPPGNRSEYFP
jgi:hypothetical protein